MGFSCGTGRQKIQGIHFSYYHEIHLRKKKARHTSAHSARTSSDNLLELQLELGHVLSCGSGTYWHFLNTFARLDDCKEQMQVFHDHFHGSL